MKPGLCPDMPLLVNDWLSSTRIALLTPTEEGALIRLLCHAWNEPDCSLPDDDATLAKLSRLGRQWHKGSGAKIRAMFTPHPESKNRLQNPKQCKLRREQEARIKAASQHASNAAKARWNRQNSTREPMPEHSAGNATASFEHMPGDASSPGSRLTVRTHTQRNGAVRCGLPASEARSAVRSAYKRPARRLKLTA
jgi:uncharacterized protein YdaU (DUF1376 family)